ncbi:hypothetical protein HUJ04_000226 [Dendroctonus ponderosae]|nr:hypothetical protein HUJ04_000226 [Dendroctonus ponderosae]
MLIEFRQQATAAPPPIVHMFPRKCTDLGDVVIDRWFQSRCFTQQLTQKMPPDKVATLRQMARPNTAVNNKSAMNHVRPNGRAPSLRARIACSCRISRNPGLVTFYRRAVGSGRVVSHAIEGHLEPIGCRRPPVARHSRMQIAFVSYAMEAIAIMGAMGG